MREFVCIIIDLKRYNLLHITSNTYQPDARVTSLLWRNVECLEFPDCHMQCGLSFVDLEAQKLMTQDSKGNPV